MNVPKRLTKYIIIGGIAYLVEMGTLLLLKKGIGLSPIQAVAISFWVGFAAAFLLQKYLTFQDYNKAIHLIAKQLFWYGLLTLWNYSFTLLVVKTFVGHTSVFVIRTAAILIITSWNFLIYSRLFKNQVVVD